MARQFKNALCLASRPGMLSSMMRYAHLCKRRSNHQGPHRVCYQDAIVEWGESIKDEYNDIDNVERLTPREGYRLDGHKVVPSSDEASNDH